MVLGAGNEKDAAAAVEEEEEEEEEEESEEAGFQISSKSSKETVLVCEGDRK